MTSLAQWWSLSDVEVFITDEDLKHFAKENAIYIMNHKYEIDWLMGWILCQRVRLLGVTFLLLFLN